MKAVVSLLFILSFLFISTTFAQENLYLMNPRGEVIPVSALKNYTPPKHKDNLKRNLFGDVLINPNNTQDTISY